MSSEKDQINKDYNKVEIVPQFDCHKKCMYIITNTCIIFYFISELAKILGETGHSETLGEQNPHYQMNGQDDDVTPPLPAKKRNDPGNRSPLPPSSSNPKVTREHAWSNDEQPDWSRNKQENERRSRSVPNDFSPKFLQRQRLGARRSNGPEGALGLAIRNSHVCIDEGIAEER